LAFDQDSPAIAPNFRLSHLSFGATPIMPSPNPALCLVIGRLRGQCIEDRTEHR